MDDARVKQSLDDWESVFTAARSSLISRAHPTLPPKGSSATLLGVRRSGKTYTAIEMTKSVPAEQVLYYNFEDPLFYAEPYVEGLERVLVVAEQYRRAPIECLVLDELQNVRGWERWVRKLIALKRYHVIVTGSSAKLLSSELATALAGRTLSTTIWPLSLTERAQFAKVDDGDQEDWRRRLAELRDLLTWGAFPEVVLLDDSGARKRLLQQYLNDIVLRDVISRQQIRNKRAFDQVLTHYLTNASSLHSYSALRKAYGVTTDTAAEYTQGLQDAFCLFEVHRYHPNLKVQARDAKKVYLIDPGLRTVGARSTQDDTGKLLENLVYLELRRRGHEISYYRGQGEVDFIVTDRYQPIAAIQVAASLAASATDKRERDALVECCSALGLKRGTIITMDEERQLKEQGIHLDVVPAWRWLRGKA